MRTSTITATTDLSPSMPSRSISVARDITGKEEDGTTQSTGTTTATRTPIMITIAPGITARLRGAEESRACLDNDFFLVTTCHSCQMDLCCIADAQFVLCPACSVVSPIEQQQEGDETVEGEQMQQDRDDTARNLFQPDTSSDCSAKGLGGVGLGFTVDELREWQCEIVKHRHNKNEASGVFA